jgi:hypothetical protein
MAYDLSNIEFTQEEAMEGLRDLNKRFKEKHQPIEVEEVDQSSYKPLFQSRRMKTETGKISPTKGQPVTLHFDD